MDTSESFENTKDHEKNILPTGTDILEISTNFEMDRTDVLKDTELEDAESTGLNLDVITDSEVQGTKNVGIDVFNVSEVTTDEALHFTDDYKINDLNVEENIIGDLMDLIAPESKIGVFSLHEEFIGKGFQVTDVRPSDELQISQNIPKLISSLSELEKKIASPIQDTHIFADDIIQSVQNVDEHDENTTDEFSSPNASRQSKLENNLPSDSTLSDLEKCQECCTEEETRNIPQQAVPTSQVEHVPPENLDPDNPLMKRFQIALNAHLHRQKSRIAEEILEMTSLFQGRRSAAKKKETEDLSTFLHSTQQALSRQHKSLEKDRKKLMNYFNQRQDVEESLKYEKAKHKEITNLVQTEQKKQANLQVEKDNLNMKISQFMTWESKMNSELTRSQLISDKNKADKKLFTQEKIKQDILLVNLSSEVLRLSAAFTEMEKNIKDKQADLTLLTQAVKDGTMDLEALEQENKRLMQVWKIVIYRIQQRDKAYNDLKIELHKAHDQFQSLISQIESYKRSTSGEIKSNESLMQTLSRLEFEVETLERQRTTEEDKQRKLREMLVQAENMIEYTQKDIDTVMAEHKEKDREITQLQRLIDKVVLQKYRYEDQILNLLQQQLTNSKVESQANKRIKQLHEECRQQEVLKSMTDNELAKTLLLIEHESKAIKDRQMMLDEEKVLEHERDAEIQSMEKEFTHLERTIATKQTRVDIINMKVAEIVAKTGTSELSPEELCIKHLEKQITEYKNNIEDLQIMWMREQNHIVTLKQQRTNQLHQLNIYRKQVLIMDHKYLKLDQEIEKYRKDESNMNRGIHLLEQRLESLNQQCFQRRGYKDMLDHDNNVAQNQLICDLKDAEVASLMILEEMCQLETDKEELRKQLIETQREMLAWEKKEKLAVETKQNMDKAKSEGGEISVMKSEIHRMEVRCAQLRKVQEKLAQDMEMCVSRRDGIMDLAYAREKRTAKGAHYTRQQFMRKLDDLKNKIRHVNSEIKSIDKSIAASGERLKDLKVRVDIEKQQLNGLQEAVTNMQADLNEGNLHWQKNLELLVRRQRKAKLYGEVKSGRYIMMIKTESGLELETQKQRTINADLISIVESLNTDFPSLDNPLAQILNTLRSPAA